MRLSTTWEPRAAVVVVVVVVVGVVCTICRRRREAKPRCARAPSPLDGHNHAQQLVDAGIVTRDVSFYARNLAQLFLHLLLRLKQLRL